MKTIYDFSVKDSKLNEVSLTKFKDKVLLIVNVASYCGLTYQYEGIENLYKKYKESGFEVLAFPCNQFALQEPGTNEEIRNFCDTKYAITFEIFNKIHVNGSKSDPLYKFLKNKMPGVAGTSQIKWNFTKFLISKNGDNFYKLVSKSIIGTGSNRRTEQLKILRDDLIVKPLRGNIDSRIGKVLNNELDAIVIAAAGINRLGLTKHISYHFDFDEIPNNLNKFT